MEGPEFVIAVVAIVFGTGLVGYLFSKVFGLVRMWLEGRSGSGVTREEYNRLGQAFVQHKKSAERRLQKLESAMADEGLSEKQIEEASSAIEVEDAGEQDEETSGGSGNLRNMLRG